LSQADDKRYGPHDVILDELDLRDQRRQRRGIPETKAEEDDTRNQHWDRLAGSGDRPK